MDFFVASLELPSHRGFSYAYEIGPDEVIGEFRHRITIWQAILDNMGTEIKSPNVREERREKSQLTK